nr:hypothetical protein [uncultured Campylobacter sp.]
MAKQISALPTAPSTQRPATFNAEADAFVAALPTFVSEANALATEAATNASKSEDANTAAQSAKDAAQASAQTAGEAKTAAIQGANSAESSAQTAAQIKEQTQAFADAAQSSAQAAKQSEQAAEQTKTELQTATNTLEQMKSIVKDGFIDDTAQSENKTYSSKKISELNETLSADVTQKLDQASKEIRTAAMSGAMPSAYESDLAMWDYMEQAKAAFSNYKARFFKDWALGVDSAIRFYAAYPNLNNRIKNNYYVSSTDRITAILDGEVIAAIAQNGTIYKQDGTTTYLNTTNPDGVSINTSNKVDSVAGKFVLYQLGGDNVAVFGLSGDDKVLKYLYKTSVADISSGYVFHDVLVINKSQAPQKTYKITNTGISEISGVELPASTPRYPTSEFYMPFYKDFLPSKNALIKADGTVKTIRICGEVLGFLGGTPYLLQRIVPLSGVYAHGGTPKKYLYAIFDVDSGNRCVLLPLDKEPLSAYLEGGYAYIVFGDGVTKIPAKYLTGANYKGE